MRKAPRPESEMKQVREAEMRAGKQIVPTGACHYCDWELGKGALWCSSECASDFAAERSALDLPT